MSESIEVRFQPYLESVSDSYQNWWKPYAFMDEIDDFTWFEFELNSKTEDKPKEQQDNPQDEPKEKTEKVQPILETLREYRHENKILIFGSSGAGKSTLLARILGQSARQAQ